MEWVRVIWVAGAVLMVWVMVREEWVVEGMEEDTAREWGREGAMALKKVSLPSVRNRDQP